MNFKLREATFNSFTDIFIHFRNMKIRHFFIKSFRIAFVFWGVHCFLILFTNQSLAQQRSPIDTSYHLVFEDNFDDTIINRNKWKSLWDWNQSGVYPDYVCPAVKKQGVSYITMNFENCPVKNGVATIVSKREHYCGTVWNWPSCDSSACVGLECNNNHCFRGNDTVCVEYTTGILISKQSFKYGYFEIRCKLPVPELPKTNQGVGPNFWLWAGSEFVSWSEIDIFEFNGLTNECGANLHYEDKNGKRFHNIRNSPVLKPDFTSFHTFSALWTPSKIQFFVDNQLYLTTRRHTSDLIAMPLIINVNFPLLTMCQPIDIENTQLPHNYEIDYVRVYQRSEKLERQSTIQSIVNQLINIF